MRSEKKFDIIIVFSNTAGFNGDYNFLTSFKQQFGDSFNFFIISPIYYEDAVKSTMKIQANNKSKNCEKQILMIFDDICGSIKDSKIIKQITTQNRHFYCTVIFAVQYKI